MTGVLFLRISYKRSLLFNCLFFSLIRRVFNICQHAEYPFIVAQNKRVFIPETH